MTATAAPWWMNAKAIQAATDEINIHMDANHPVNVMEMKAALAAAMPYICQDIATRIEQDVLPCHPPKTQMHEAACRALFAAADLVLRYAAEDAVWTVPPTLTQFLLARIDEDVIKFLENFAVVDEGEQAVSKARLLAECHAKRQIVERARLFDAAMDARHRSGRLRTEPESQHTVGFLSVLPFLALPYSDHPDYRQEWKP